MRTVNNASDADAELLSPSDAEPISIFYDCTFSLDSECLKNRWHETVRTHLQISTCFPFQSLSPLARLSPPWEEDSKTIGKVLITANLDRLNTPRMIYTHFPDKTLCKTAPKGGLFKGLFKLHPLDRLAFIKLLCKCHQNTLTAISADFRKVLAVHPEATAILAITPLEDEDCYLGKYGALKILCASLFEARGELSQLGIQDVQMLNSDPDQQDFFTVTKHSRYDIAAVLFEAKEGLDRPLRGSTPPLEVKATTETFHESDGLRLTSALLAKD